MRTFRERFAPEKFRVANNFVNMVFTSAVKYISYTIVIVMTSLATRLREKNVLWVTVTSTPDQSEITQPVQKGILKRPCSLILTF